MSEAAWHNQSKTLVEVQRYGSNLEREVRNLLDWDGGRIEYDLSYGYKVQVDCAWPSLSDPQVIASVTYSDPDTPGHSNENKLQLKLGELVLLKNRYPNLKAVLVLGGTKEAWLPYVLDAFHYFYDEVICLWEDSGVAALANLKNSPLCVTSKHEEFWDSLRNGWSRRTKDVSESEIPTGLVRYAVLDQMKSDAGHSNPQNLANEIARFCMQASYENSGTEWGHYRRENWNAIEMSRSYFNPVEALVEISLQSGDFHYQGGVAKDVEVNSFLHQLGMVNTKMSEDFILYSDKLNRPVYIQCKASGGGRTQHGKNIQNRTKEQVARGILYTSVLDERGSLTFKAPDFHWIGVVDGNWNVTQSEPAKYMHMLQMAGYGEIIAASELVDIDLNVKKELNNPLVRYLEQLQCRKI